MKKSLLASLLFATALFTVGCSDKSAEKSSQATDSTGTQNIAYSGKIAFVRMDSLMNSYGMFIDKNDEFTKKQAKAQEELAIKAKSLEREALDYQDKAQKGLVTRYQAATIEEGLNKKQQEIGMYRERLLSQLAEEQSVVSNTISKAVVDYLTEYNVDHKYSLILQTMGGNPVILADPALDITKDVVAELNRRYQDSLAKKTK